MLDSHAPGNAVSNGPVQVVFLELCISRNLWKVQNYDFWNGVLPTRMGDAAPYELRCHKGTEQDITDHHSEAQLNGHTEKEVGNTADVNNWAWLIAYKYIARKVIDISQMTCWARYTHRPKVKINPRPGNIAK